jgi:hypothetical protein
MIYAYCCCKARCRTEANQGAETIFRLRWMQPLALDHEILSGQRRGQLGKHSATDKVERTRRDAWLVGRSIDRLLDTTYLSTKKLARREYYHISDIACLLDEQAK